MTPSDVATRVGSEAHLKQHVAICRVAAINLVGENLLEVGAQRVGRLRFQHLTEIDGQFIVVFGRSGSNAVAVDISIVHLILFGRTLTKLHRSVGMH